MNTAEKRQTICWSCARATGNCPWSEANNMHPVKGWTAEKVKIRCAKDHHMESYCVIECPLFLRDSLRNGQVRLSEKERKEINAITKKDRSSNMDRSDYFGSYSHSGSFNR